MVVILQFSVDVEDSFTVVTLDLELFLTLPADSLVRNRRQGERF